MATISLSLPSDGQTIDAADVNTPLNTISAVINGNLDDDNVKVGANINGTKLLINSIPPTAGDANMRGGWNAGIVTAMPTVTALGNRSYSLVHATTDLTGYLSPGMRLKLTRTATAPTQCTSLNGTTQGWSKATPTGITFVGDHSYHFKIKPTAYQSGFLMSRLTGGLTGFALLVTSTGQIQIQYGNGASLTQISTYQSVPLNKETTIDVAVSVAAKTAVVLFDGTSVPTFLVAGTATTVVQPAAATTIAIGMDQTPANFFAGSIAQAWLATTAVATATLQAMIGQTVTGAESNCIGAWTFNGNANDSNANANNLSATGSAVATATSPFFAQGATAGSLEYGIITATSFSTNTTLTVQVPEGSALPTSGGVSAISYSTQAVPYGFPRDKNKWRLASILKTAGATTSNVTYGAYLSAGYQLIVPIGVWDIGQLAGNVNNASTTEVNFNISSTALTGLTKATGSAASPFAVGIQSSAAAFTTASYNISRPSTIAAQSTYIMYTIGATTQATIQGDTSPAEIFAEFSYL